MANQFDGPNLIITLEPVVGGVLTVDVLENLYEDAKDWYRAHPENRRFPFPFVSDGGNPLTAVINQGSYIFLQNLDGWRIKPAENDGTYYFIGNLGVQTTELPALIPTTGAFTAAILGLQPVTQGVTETMKNQLEINQYNQGITIDVANGDAGVTWGSGEDPIGSTIRPVNNLADALVLLNVYGFNKVFVKGPLTLDSQTWPAGTKFIGNSIFASTVTVTAGANVQFCEFHTVQLQGVLSGFARINDSLIVGNTSNVSGFFDRCAFNEVITTLGAGQTNFVDCKSNVAGSGSPTIDLNGTGSEIAGRGYIGGMKFQNKTGTDDFSWDQTSGHLQALATCTAGDMTFRGIGRVTDLSTGACNVNDTAMVSGTRTVKGQGYVSINAAGSAGTAFPIGTDDVPVNNIAEAITIAEQNNVMRIKLYSDIATAGTEDLTGYTLYADSAIEAALTITLGTTTTKTIFRDVRLTGALNGTVTHIERCRVDNLTGVIGFVYKSTIITNITFAGDTNVWNCKIDPEATGQTCTFDFDGLTSTVIMSNWGAGRVLADNMITDSFMGFAGTGRVIPTINNTGGTVVYAGLALVDETEAARLDELRDSTNSRAVWDKVLDATYSADQMLQELHMFKGLNATKPVTIGGDGVTTSTWTANGKLVTITTTDITRT